jgi:hypothetical protein
MSKTIKEKNPEVSTSTKGSRTVSVSTTSPTVTEVTTTKGSTTGTFVLVSGEVVSVVDCTEVGVCVTTDV